MWWLLLPGALYFLWQASMGRFKEAPGPMIFLVAAYLFVWLVLVAMLAGGGSPSCAPVCP